MCEQPADAFWRYSLALYGAPGVASACLALQERHGVDVNLLLLCCWLGSRGIRLDQRAVGRLLGAAKPWHDHAVRPLRAVRQRLKQPLGAVPREAAEALRQRVKALELEAERLEQTALAETAPSAPSAEPGPAAIAANLAQWARTGGFAWEEWDIDELAALLAAAFPDRAAEVPDLAASIITPRQAAHAC